MVQKTVAHPLNYKKLALFCGGCNKGQCFYPDYGEQVWNHLKEYRRDKEYADTSFVKTTCLRVCMNGPILQVLDLSGKNSPIEYRLHAENVEEAKQKIDRIMEEHVLGGVPVQEFLDNWL